MATKSGNKGRYICKVGFYDIYAKDTLKPKKESKSSVEESELSVEEKNIFSALRHWRNDLAKESGWSAFRICHNSHLISIAKANPQTIEELKSIKSFGESRTANYGDDIISLLNAL